MEVNDSQQNYITGYVKFFRSMMNKGWYKKSDYVHLWVHLLLKATHKDQEIMINGNRIILKPGQFLTGRKKLSEETGIHESSVERMLTYFEKIEQQIEQQKYNTTRLISICNWHLYQISEQQIEQPLNNHRTTTEQQLNTYNNDNKEKNEKKRRKSSPIAFVPPTLEDVIIYFKKNGYKKQSAERFFEYYTVSNWVDSKNNPVSNWKQKALAVWFKDENKEGVMPL